MINSSKLHYFTSDYEWIDFQGSIALVGICEFKLKELKAVDRIQYSDVSAVIKKGEILSEDDTILMRMPVDDRFIKTNDRIVFQPERFLQDQINNWIAKYPFEPYSWNELTVAKA
jgi:glycine cleavage system H lipoate-binding protein